LCLEADLLTGQLAGKGRGLSAGLSAVKDDGRAKGFFVLIEQSDEKRVVSLGDSAKLTLWSVGAEMNVGGHGSRVHTLTESACCSLDSF